jgi:hypothetical protein
LRFRKQQARLIQLKHERDGDADGLNVLRVNLRAEREEIQEIEFLRELRDLGG